MSLQKNSLNINKLTESILVVPTKSISLWQGFKSENIYPLLNVIEEKKEFYPRYLMEEDQNYKQIIPYIIFKFENQIFVMQRKSTASEQRLKDKLSIGIGGHIRREDIENESISNWAKREFFEEVEYKGSFKTELLGLINDDSNEVGKVHLGIVFLLEGESSDIKIKSELKNGSLVEISQLNEILDKMENWSQLASKHIIKKCLTAV